MQTHALPSTRGLPSLPRANSWVSEPWRPVPQPLPMSGRRRALGQLATAALLLLTLVAGFLAFGSGRPEPQLESPAFLPAISGTPASPETGATSIAELVWQAKGGPDLPFRELGQPAVDPEGKLWVPDASYGQFLIFAPDGTFLEAWGTPGSGEGEFNFASAEHGGFGYGGVAFDATGTFYVVDTGNYRIQKFGPDREFITAWGSEGSGPGQFRRPFAVVVDEGGRVYVSDPGWGKIEVFDRDGKWLATWSGLGSPYGLAVDGPRGVDLTGNGGPAIWVAESSGLVKFSAEGDRLATWNDYGSGQGAFLLATSVAADSEGRVYVADMDAVRVQVFAPDGTYLGAWGEKGSEPGRFLAPHGIAVDDLGGVYVVERSERVQKFRLLPPLASPVPTAARPTTSWPSRMLVFGPTSP
jgi:DNA-binding beta-propeller fold protein YncE